MLLPRFEMSEAEVVRRSHAVQWLAQLTTTPRWLPVIRTGYLILEILDSRDFLDSRKILFRIANNSLFKSASLPFK